LSGALSRASRQFSSSSSRCRKAHSDDQSHDAWTKAPANDLQRVDGDDRLVGTVSGMEMRRRMVVVVHRDDDSEKPADLRHQVNLAQPERSPHPP
jgi:hypothetical protein